MKLVLTGSSSGIGRALAGHLLARGHQVWGIARTDQSAFAAQHAGGFRVSRCDVSNWGQVAYAAAEITAAWPHLDGLITCAGLQGEIGRALRADPVNWSTTVRANLDGTFFAVRAQAPLLAQAPRRAKIVCFSGGGGARARPNFSAYGAAKTGVVRLVETIAEEERGRPLDINAIAPGGINTRLTEEILKLGPAVVGEAEYASAQKQQGAGGAPIEKVLGLADWLLSPASDGISGRLLSAQWDDWSRLTAKRDALAQSDLYTLRRITPEDHGATGERGK